MLDIQKIQSSAVKEADNLLKTAQNLIDEVRAVIIRGSDTLNQAQVEEWLLVIPVIISEISPIKDAYELTRKLYTIDGSIIESQAFLQSSDKGAVREANVKLSSTQSEIDKSIMYYIRDRAGNIVDALHSLLMSLMKIYGAKVGAPKES